MKRRQVSHFHSDILLIIMDSADLEREQQVLQSATELWQAHHERLLQENGQLRQWAEQELHTKAAESETRQAALSADVADARSKLEPLVAEDARLRSAQVSITQALVVAAKPNFIAAYDPLLADSAMSRCCSLGFRVY